MKGTRTEPGYIRLVESLKRRTQIDRHALKLEVDKKSWPWKVRVEGVRQLVGEGPSGSQPFRMELELVRASRSEILEGLLVWRIISFGDPLLRAAESRGE